MSPRHAVRARRRAARHAKGLRNHPFLRTIGLTLTAVMAFGVTGAATAYTRLQNNISSADVEHLLGDRPATPTPDPNDPNAGAPVNILVMGTDSRIGNEDIAGDKIDGQRSDTTILMHVSADRQRVDLVSIPRDSLVELPECLRSDGTSTPARSNAMFNDAFAYGGMNGSTTDAAACTQRTVEANTGVYIHHFVVVDMSGFVNMVDALGGIPMCIPHDMRSRKAQLDITAGNHILDGSTALAFARARTGEGLGDGSDTGRIGRQQELLANTAREVLSKNLLTDVPELYRFLTSATQSLTVSKQLSTIPDMAGLAFSLREVPAGNITFMTVPFAPAPQNPNRVVWTSEAQSVWENIANDRPMVDEPEDEPSTQEPETGGTDESSDTDESGDTDEDETSGSGSTVKPGVDAFTPDDVTVC